MEKNLGHATAYGYAKSKGYSGTEEEFAELMADYASVGQSAAQSASEAAASATSASGSAAAASQAAQTATDKASEAVTAAGTATTKASEASQSATNANHSAESASTSAYTATAKAGTATAKADAAAASEAAALSAKTDAESARDAAAQSATNAANSAIEAAQSAQSVDAERLNRIAFGSYVVEESSGAIAHFEDGADNIPMKDVLVHIEPVQGGSGDPSPENVRPITGWTGAKVTKTGKNLLKLDETEMVQHGWNEWFPLTIKAGTYTMSCQNKPFVSGAERSIQVRLTDLNKTPIINISSGYAYGDGVKMSFSFSITEEQSRNVAGIVFEPVGGAIVFSSLDNMKNMLELGSTATAYEPYSGQIYDIPFPTEAGTVYGGTLDITSGVLTVTHKLYTFDGSENWTAGNYGLRYEFNLGGLPDYIKTWNSGGRGLSNLGIYDSTAYTNDVDYITSRVAVGASTTGAKTHVLVLPASIATTVEELKAFLANTPEQWYAPLQTPQTYQLTPQEITSLLGTNNLWADTGNSDVEYRADTKLYITKKITEAVSALS